MTERSSASVSLPSDSLGKLLIRSRDSQMLSFVLSKSVVGFLRRLVRLLGVTLLVAACSGSSYTAEEISHALAELQPPDVGMTWGEFFVSCALDAVESIGRARPKSSEDST